MALLTHWEGEPVEVWARLWGVPALEVHDSVGSTNDRARELGIGGARPFTTVLADEQTEGRGRSGARWYSAEGAGLLMSVVFPPRGTPPLHLPLLVGLAAARAVEEAAPEVEVGIKWPNDLLVDGRKVGGILCEGGPGAILAGVGINVRPLGDGIPGEVRARATSVEEAAGARVSRGALAGAVLNQLRGLCGGDGVDMGEELAGDLHAELARRDVLAGRAVVTVQGGRGTARGVDRDGALVLERRDGSRIRLVAGSVDIV